MNTQEVKEFIKGAFQYQPDTDQDILNNDIKGVKEFKDYLFNNEFEIRDCYYSWGSELMEEVLEAIQDCQDIEEIQSEIEALNPNTDPDDYTSNITSWLNSNNEYIYYLTEALEYGIKDGFQLLQQAQSIHIQEVKGLVKQALLDYLEEIEKDL